MDGQKHIINREILELTVPDRERALPFQNKASEIIKYRLNPALDKLFSKISSPKEVVSIDRLVIDLGTLSAANLDEDFIRLAIKNAEDELSRVLIKKRSEVATGRSAAPPEKQEKVSIKSLKANYLEQFIHFLETGNLSWWKTPKTLELFENIVEEVLSLEKAIVQQQVLPLLKNPSIRKRFVYQLSDQQLLHFSILSGFDEQSPKKGFTQEVTKLFKSKKVFIKRFRTTFWMNLYWFLSEKKSLKTDFQKITFLRLVLSESFADLSRSTQITAVKAIIEQLLPGSERVLSEKTLLLLTALFSFSRDQGFKSKKITGLSVYLKLEKQPKFQEFLNELAQGKEFASDKKAKERKKEEVDQKLTPEKKAAENYQTEKLTTETRPLDGEEIVVSNAGLVILYPFLRHFFEGLGFLNKELQFKCNEHAAKAVHLLQFIAYKSKVNPEFELSLNKILCGLELWEPIPLEVKITKSETEECENLLQVVLDRWDVLKTKNTDALRETFLIREGKLTFENHGWNLNVERNSFDILLDKLPWGISIIKLPWSSQIIHVEW